MLSIYSTFNSYAKHWIEISVIKFEFEFENKNFKSKILQHFNNFSNLTSTWIMNIYDLEFAGENPAKLATNIDGWL